MKNKTVDALSLLCPRSNGDIMNWLYTLLSRISLLVRFKLWLNVCEMKYFIVLQKILKQLRYLFPVVPHAPSLHFAIVCVKRPTYVQLAIQNVNSLHFYCPQHQVTLYVDAVCMKEFKKYKGLLHYPSQVNVKLTITSTSKPWQYSKIEMLILASKHNQILMDADGIWRGVPHISADKVTFLVKAYEFQTNAHELLLLSKVIHKLAWKKFSHYVTGFVSIPPVYMTKTLAQDCTRLTQSIFKHSHTYLSDKSQKNSMKRLAEEIGVSLAVQKHVPASKITVLKKSDGPGDRNILQSMYYGCTNEILQ